MNLHLLLAASPKAAAATTGCSIESLEDASITTEREKTEQGEQTEASTTTAAAVVNGGAIVGATGCVERRIQTRCTGTVDCCIDNADGGHDNRCVLST